MHYRNNVVICIAVLLAVTAIFSRPASAALHGKKIVQYSADFPDTKFYRENIKAMEQMGFDGYVIRVSPKYIPFGDPGWSLGYETFTPKRIDPKVLEGPIADLRSTPSSILTENFIQISASLPADVEWFDPEWDAVPHNAAMLARVAKQGGFRGLMIDTEEYGPNHLWSYGDWTPEVKVKHTYTEYKAQVRKRGREFIQAINKEYPDITLLLLLGPSYSYAKTRALAPQVAGYSLVADFVDGMCEAATPGTVIVDGYEQSYGYWRPSFFDLGRRYILEDCLRMSAVPGEYREHVRVGFGVGPDLATVSKFGEDPTQLPSNFWTPDEFRNALAYAMDASDKYVWVWSGKGWWVGDKILPGYSDALKLAKKGPARLARERGCPSPSSNTKAASLDGYSDEETFAGFYKTMDDLLDLPKGGWRFARDRDDVGQAQRWFAANFDDSRWRSISIGEFWEAQGEDYDGLGWYRRCIAVPHLPENERVYLAFGAVDEDAWVYVNGQYVGNRVIGEGGWDKPFRIDVTGVLKFGQPNLVAVRVLDTGRIGGIWKSDKLMVDKGEAR